MEAWKITSAGAYGLGLQISSGTGNEILLFGVEEALLGTAFVGSWILGCVEWEHDGLGMGEIHRRAKTG